MSLFRQAAPSTCPLAEICKIVQKKIDDEEPETSDATGPADAKPEPKTGGGKPQLSRDEIESKLGRADF